MPKLSPGVLLIAFFAILMGLAAAYVVKRQLAREPARQEVVVEKPQVIPLASMNLPVGRTVTSGDMMLIPITQKEWLARHLPAEVLNNGQQVIGRILKIPIAKGEAFTPGSFYPDGMQPPLSERLKPGSRAVTVAVGRIDALDGQAVPGSLVDVLFRTKPVEKEEIPETTVVLLKDIELLALGTNSTPGLHAGLDPKAEETAVTLAVSAEQEARLAVVAGHGELSLVLRPSTDQVTPTDHAFTLREVLNLPPPAPKPQPFVAEIYRAGRRQTIVFEGTQVAEEKFGGVDIQPPAPKQEEPPPPEQPAAPGQQPTTPGQPPILPPGATPDNPTELDEPGMTLAQPLADAR